MLRSLNVQSFVHVNAIARSKIGVGRRMVLCSRVELSSSSSRSDSAQCVGPVYPSCAVSLPPAMLPAER